MTYGLHLVLNIQAPQAYSKIQSTHKSVQLLLLSTFAPARHPFGLLPLPNLAREAFFGATLALLAIATYLPPPDANISIVTSTSSYLGTIGPAMHRRERLKLSMSRLCNIAPKNCKCASYTSEQDVEELMSTQECRHSKIMLSTRSGTQAVER